MTFNNETLVDFFDDDEVLEEYKDVISKLDDPE
jgi:hypothetical protein